ncbi:MAG: hypothetical protein ABEK04_03625 [Candidatus Nanohalobium sp.]
MGWRLKLALVIAAAYTAPYIFENLARIPAYLKTNSTSIALLLGLSLTGAAVLLYLNGGEIPR